MYRVQFPVMQQNERDTWYDMQGRLAFTVSKGLVGVGLRMLVHQAWAVVPVSVVMVIVYAGVSLLLGVDDDERRIAQSFLVRPAAGQVF